MNERGAKKHKGYQPRAYRDIIKNSDLVKFRVVVKETDLLISAEKDLRYKAEKLARKYYKQVEDYIKSHPEFGSSFVPLDVCPEAPLIIKVMAQATAKADVGPMAAVAGAIAEFIGFDLLKDTSQVIIENGGDIFIKSSLDRNVMIYAGESKLSQRLGLKIKTADTPCGICTSSGTVGHSFSYGRADAVVVVSKSAAIADAFATAVCNQVKSDEDIEKGLVLAQNNAGDIKGMVIIIRDKLGSWGQIELTRVTAVPDK